MKQTRNGSSGYTRRPTTPRYRRPDVQANSMPEIIEKAPQGDHEGLYGVMENAFQEMTTNLYIGDHVFNLETLVLGCKIYDQAYFICEIM
jgi:hypothetical protein